MRIDVLNGVNLDVLGKRDPSHYGGLSLGELETRVYDWGGERAWPVRCRETTHEGEYVGWCHDAMDVDGLVVNPGAWTHYSWAIRDALELVRAPIVEVHLSDVENREEWRRVSVLDGLATRRILGRGPDGYREALEFLVRRP